MIWDDLISEPLICPECGVLLRDEPGRFFCPSCDHTVPIEQVERPTDGDDLPGVWG